MFPVSLFLLSCVVVGQFLVFFFFLRFILFNLSFFEYIPLYRFLYGCSRYYNIQTWHHNLLISMFNYKCSIENLLPFISFLPLLLKYNCFKYFFYIYWALKNVVIIFASSVKYDFRNSWGQLIVFTFIFSHSIVCFFLSEVPNLLLLSFSTWTTLFHHSLRVGVLGTHCFSFLSFEEVFFSFSFPRIVSLDTEFT